MNIIKGLLAKARALAGTPLGAQVGRFVRLAVVSGVGAFEAAGQPLSKAAVFGAAIGGIEVAYRQIRPALAGALAARGLPPDVLPVVSAVAANVPALVTPPPSLTSSTPAAPPADAVSPHQGA